MAETPESNKYYSERQRTQVRRPSAGGYGRAPKTDAGRGCGTRQHCKPLLTDRNSVYLGVELTKRYLVQYFF